MCYVLYVKGYYLSNGSDLQAGSRVYSVLHVVTVMYLLGIIQCIAVISKHVLCHLALNYGKHKFRLKPPVPVSSLATSFLRSNGLFKTNINFVWFASASHRLLCSLC
jgi:hypothetical protein